MTGMRYGLSLVLWLWFAFDLAAQGPISGFMPARGQLTLAWGQGTEQFDTYFNESGEGLAQSAEIDFQQLFAEFGFSDSFSLVATLPYLAVANGQRGWQDLSVWLKFRNLQRTLPSGAGRSLITAAGISTPISGYSAGGIQGAIGRRATVFHGRVAWQQNYNSGWFIHGQAGLDFQFAPTAQLAFPFLARAGRGGRWTYFDFWLERNLSLETVAEPTAVTAGTGSSWTRAGGTLFGHITPWLGLNAGVAYVFSGVNIGQSLRWNVGAVVNLHFAHRRLHGQGGAAVWGRPLTALKGRQGMRP
jgi:hypothetical protein